MQRIQEPIDTLEHFPERCSRMPECAVSGEAYRNVLIGPYRIIIKIAADRVIVMRGRHGARLVDMALPDRSAVRVPTGGKGAVSCSALCAGTSVAPLRCRHPTAVRPQRGRNRTTGKKLRIWSLRPMALHQVQTLSRTVGLATVLRCHPRPIEA